MKSPEELVVHLVAMVTLGVILYYGLRSFARSVAELVVNAVNDLLDERAKEREKIRKLKYGKKKDENQQRRQGDIYQ
jgi:hypothetical protein